MVEHPQDLPSSSEYGHRHGGLVRQPAQYGLDYPVRQDVEEQVVVEHLGRPQVVRLDVVRRRLLHLGQVVEGVLRAHRQRKLDDDYPVYELDLVAGHPERDRFAVGHRPLVRLLRVAPRRQVLPEASRDGREDDVVELVPCHGLDLLDLDTK